MAESWFVIFIAISFIFIPVISEAVSEESTHIHGDIKGEINGQTAHLSREEFQMWNGAFHLEDGDGYT